MIVYAIVLVVVALVAFCLGARYGRNAEARAIARAVSTLGRVRRAYEYLAADVMLSRFPAFDRLRKHLQPTTAVYLGPNMPTLRVAVPRPTVWQRVRAFLHL